MGTPVVLNALDGKLIKLSSTHSASFEESEKIMVIGELLSGTVHVNAYRSSFSGEEQLVLHI